MAVTYLKTQQVLARMCRKASPRALVVGLRTGAAAMDNIWRFFKKLKVELPYNPAILLLGFIQRISRHQFMHPYVHCSIIYNCQDLGAT